MIASSIFPKEIFTAGFSTRSSSVYEDKFTVPFSPNIFRMSQVHSSNIIVVSGSHVPEDVARTEADAMITNRRGILLSVWVADCVPVLLAQKQGLCAAAVHAGWRGLAARIIPAALEKMKADFGVDPESVYASVGPAIGPCCYTVGQDVAKKLADSCSDPSVISMKEGSFWADLHKIARLQLIQSSLKPSNIEVVNQCTKCNETLFYSRRRGNITERQCGFIGMNSQG